MSWNRVKRRPLGGATRRWCRTDGGRGRAAGVASTCPPPVARQGRSGRRIARPTCRPRPLRRSRPARRSPPRLHRSSVRKARSTRSAQVLAGDAQAEAADATPAPARSGPQAADGSGRRARSRCPGAGGAGRSQRPRRVEADLPGPVKRPRRRKTADADDGGTAESFIAQTSAMEDGGRRMLARRFSPRMPACAGAMPQRQEYQEYRESPGIPAIPAGNAGNVGSVVASAASAMLVVNSAGNSLGRPHVGWLGLAARHFGRLRFGRHLLRQARCSRPKAMLPRPTAGVAANCARLPSPPRRRRDECRRQPRGGAGSQAMPSAGSRCRRFRSHVSGRRARSRAGARLPGKDGPHGTAPEQVSEQRSGHAQAAQGAGGTRAPGRAAKWKN